MTYNEYKNLDYPQLADDVLAHWEDTRAFERSVENRAKGLPFTFYEGPPSANGAPGIHHVMARTIKDIFCRYQTLRGRRVDRKGGWDTHGLPIELQVEKELGITKDDIGNRASARYISVADYNQRCRETVMRFTDQWNELTRQMGYWVDLDNPYVTYQTNYIESVWWLLKQLYDKGLLYKGYTIQPFSPKAGTGLSSHELNQPGTYRDVRDTTIVAQFKVKRTDRSAPLFAAAEVFGVDPDVFVLAWTTTPWTLPANSALTVGRSIPYVLVKTVNQYTHRPINVVLASALVSRWFDAKGKDGDFGSYDPALKGAVIPWQIMAEMTGDDLLGIDYEQLMPYVQPNTGKAFRIIPGDFVTTEDGTGIVHTSPTFGADDFRVAQAAGIPAIMVKDEFGKEMPVVDRQGRFVAQITDFAGRYVKEEYYSDEERAEPGFKPTDVLISIKLKEENKAFRVEKYEHPYPHCWRTDKPILYYPLDSWFIKTTAKKDELVKLNNTIKWHPESTGTGRFGNWLENLVDWNLSRSRFWGTPLPIWRSRFRMGDLPWNLCVGSFDDLNAEGWYYFGGARFDEFQKEFFGIVKKINGDLLSTEEREFHKKLGLSVSDLALNQGWLTSITELTPQVLEELSFKINPGAGAVNFDFVAKYLAKPSEIFADPAIDYHRPYVDNIVCIKSYTSSQQKVHVIYTREPDLIDVWFDSGAMPYAQWHYPFENKDKFASAFPADFISEGVDQTRGWFFTLHAIAGLVFDSVAFKKVVSTGLVLDKDGNKMSKRLGNAIDPFETLATYGPDATRWYMITNAEPWDNLRFNPDGVAEVQRRFFGTLFNTYNFFALYANLDGYQTEQFERIPRELPELDRWILSKLNTLIAEVTAQFDGYNPTKAGRLIQDFVNDELSNWYVRLARRRFWTGNSSTGEMSDDKQSAYQTLKRCLTTVAQLMSPIAPFFADWLHQNMTGTSGSVHLTDWYSSDNERIDLDLEQSMALAQQVSSLVHSLRKGHKLKVRQPLSRVLIPVGTAGQNADTRRQIGQVAALIQAEVNVKAIEFVDDAGGMLTKRVKPNFKALGPRFGKQMKAVADLITAMTPGELAQLEQTGDLRLATYDLTISDVEILTEDIPGWLVASEGGLIVALDVTVTDALRREGIARDLVNRIQNARKDLDFAVTDKISIRLTPESTDEANTLLTAAIAAHRQYICDEVQAVSLDVIPVEANGLADNKPSAEGLIEVDEFRFRLRLSVV